jgi:hypothetical protein
MTAQSGERFEEFPTPAHGTRMPVPTPPNGGSSPRAIAVFTGVAGLIVGAALASGAWLLFGNGDPSSSPVSAPARIGEYYRFPDVPKLASGENPRKTVDRQNRYDRESTTRLSAAHDGAGAVVQRYSNADLDAMFTLQVVRAPSPKPFVPFTDPEDLGLDKPMEEVLEFGSVSCAVHNGTGQPPIAVICLRTTDDLTVSITHVNGDIAPADVASLVDDAWSEVS